MLSGNFGERENSPTPSRHHAERFETARRLRRLPRPGDQRRCSRCGYGSVGEHQRRLEERVGPVEGQFLFAGQAAQSTAGATSPTSTATDCRNAEHAVDGFCHRNGKRVDTGGRSVSDRRDIFVDSFEERK
ncbi:hypothetical protein Tsp_01651 [Trichinella spiralis]|uniref:hypothetical protein n=1 Tax=Trichinella spiralis TaxID=6334 RepID=UPI0001EFC496|nr:hypothetical protein Tsp_01651 [Trichinella spiralis]